MASPTTYAVLLREAGQPNAEAVCRAFRQFRHLTDADAIRLAANAQGILMRHLNVDEAKALQQALGAEGVNAALAKDDELRFLPSARRVHHAELSSDALLIFDHLNRALAVPWNEVSLVAAGAVPHVEISSSVQHPGVGIHSLFRSGARSAPRSQLETTRQLVLELITRNASARYEIHAHDFHFHRLPALPATSLMERFVWLVREMSQRTTGAVLNRGVQDIRDGITLVRGYPSRQALLDEMVWLLWSEAHRRHG